VSWTIESVREAEVDPAAVFALYADPATWSRWGHNASWAHADGPLVEGGTVDVRANYRVTYHCLIRRFEPGRAIELVVRPIGLHIINIYEVEPTPRGARIRHAFEVSGPFAPLTRLIGLPRIYQSQLDDEVAALIRMAANPSETDPDPGAVGSAA
jgi:polyketide cyclase/dehydrase/lipid transport protein